MQWRQCLREFTMISMTRKMRLKTVAMTAAIAAAGVIADVGRDHGATAFARFDETNRSVEFTGETLPAGDFEIGLFKAHAGVTDSLMVTTLPLAGLLGFFAGGAAWQISLPRRLRLTPSFEYFGGTNASGGPTIRGGIGMGLNRGDRLQHSFTVNVRGKREPHFVFGTFDEETGNQLTPDRHVQRNSLWLGFDYSYYTPGGNLAYVGSEQLVPYFGFTWAWDHVHAGLIVAEINSWSLKAFIPADIPVDKTFSYFLPLPYIYVRF